MPGDTSRNKGILFGSICVALSQLLFGFTEVIVQSSDLKIAQYIIGEYTIRLIGVCTVWNTCKPRSVTNWFGDPPHVGNIWARGLLHITSFSTFYAIMLLPLGDLQCIFYQSPLWIVFLGRVWLKEPLPNVYILMPMTVLACTGIILVTQPSFLLRLFACNDDHEPLNIYGVIAIIISALKWTFCALLVRKAQDAHFLQLEFVSSGCTLFFAPPLMITINQYANVEEFGNLDFWDDAQWQFDLWSFGITTLLALFSCTGLALSIIGYQHGTATTVSWLEYINIPIGFVYQTFVFGDTPNFYEIVGGIMITFACVLPSAEIVCTHMIYKNGYGLSEVEDTCAELSDSSDSDDVICD
eukprot:206888_1